MFAKQMKIQMNYIWVC